jgi:hypothetical protein
MKNANHISPGAAGISLAAAFASVGSRIKRWNLVIARTRVRTPRPRKEKREKRNEEHCSTPAGLQPSIA